MAAKIPFEREMDFEYGVVERISPRVRRVVADNPGPFTYTGTNVFIIGEGEVAVLDPGPDTPAHRKALWAALDGERVAQVLVTHHHMDHTPLARPLAEAHGCPVSGYGPVRSLGDTGEVRMEAGDHVGFKPDIRLHDGDTVAGPNWTLTALHTPGHTSNHMCYALKEEQALFCGDHVMAWSTSVVSPPDGDMGEYLASLARIRDMDFATLWPTHGPPVRDPAAYVTAYIDHRRAREAQILERLRAGDARIKDMVAAMYADVDKRLHPAACHSVYAHVLSMVKDGRIQCEGEPGLDATYRAAGSAAA